MRIAAVLKDRCQTKKCNTECIKYCPKVRTGVQAIWLNDSSKAEISEELCAGCGICAYKCPTKSLTLKRKTVEHAPPATLMDLVINIATANAPQGKA